MNAQRIVRALVGVFTRDVGRKLLALFFALVLFAVLDRQVQTDETLTVPVKYVDESDLDAEKDREAGSILFVVERAGVGKPLIVADSVKPRSAALQLHASKDALERARTRRHLLIWRLGKEGPLTPMAEDLDGIEADRKSVV